MSKNAKYHLSNVHAALIIALFGLTPLQALATTKVTEVEGISEYRLDNGLKVLLFPDPSKETVTVNITYQVGSKHENYGETGMAHLLEHLVFKGSPKHKDIPSELSSHGARPNGTTWTDRTNYFETFAATENNINWALSMESDRMVNSFIAKKDLDSEMTVVRNEFESGENNPNRITMQRMLATAFDWHNYGKSTIGARSDLENVSIDNLQAFYKKYYQPDNATLIVAGKFKTEDLLTKIADTFGQIPKPDRTIAPLYTLEPAQDGERQVTVRRVGDVQLLGAVYHAPQGSHPDFAAINVLNEILSATPNGRLHKSLVEAKLASSIIGMNFQWQDPGVAIFLAKVDKTADIAKSQQVFIQTLESVKENTINNTEVELAKQTLLKNLNLSFNSSETIALALSEWLGMGDWRLLFLNRDQLEQVTVADVQRVAEYYFTQNNRTLGRFIPADKPARVDIPLVEDVAALTAGYKGREAIAQGEAFDPSQDNIDSRTQTVTLDSGAKLSLLEKKTRGESVVVQISAQMGSVDSLQGLDAAGNAVGAMLMRGTNKYDRTQIKAELDKLQTTVNVKATNGNLFVSIETNKANLLPSLAIIETVLRHPSFPKNEFEVYKNETKVKIEQALQDPQRLAFEEFSRHQSPYAKKDPRYVPTFEEQLVDLNALTLEHVKQYHKSLYGARQMQISVIGDFDPAKTEHAFAQLTKGWKADKPYSLLMREYIPLKNEPITFNTPDKENATFVASTSLPVGENHADAAALTLGNYILGGGFLSSRLATRLRQQDGLSYGAGSFIDLDETTNRASLAAYAICAPQNLKKVDKGFKEEVARLLKDGFTEEEVTAAKSGLLQSRKVSRSQDDELARNQTTNLRLGRTMEFNKDFENQLSKLTAEDLNRAFRQYIKVENFAIIQAGDMSKAI
ncbi:M16 family metallopeptidase [Shewanella baltica]|uniref:M16 family metallopeptidase n=1 Tax=Shewanella baltica TaxID=62322 RepID=UPI00217D483C|nr:pitrilysin family protein [Shewanella baltica]MCS6096628.1 insulinase family protein [Shewanella baltica]MCS6227736.1 insulinase family protein [Shewanella baltica]